MITEITRAAPPANAILPTDAGQDLVAGFTEILVGPRSGDTPSFLDSIFEKANPHRGLGGAEPDVVLLDLFGFTPSGMPQFDNTLCAELGRLSEQLVALVFEATRGKLVRRGKAFMEELKEIYLERPVHLPQKGNQWRQVSWKAPDFVFGKSIVEVKYRFNSYQNKMEQIEVALAYARLGYTPEWIHISPDCQQLEDFRNSGWTVRVGEDAIAWIDDHTGIDFREILRQVADQPAIAARLKEGRRRINARWQSEMIRDIDYAPDVVRDGVYAHIAGRDEHFGAVLQKRSPLSEEEFEQIRRGSRDIAEKNISETQDSDIDDLQEIIGIFQKIDEEKKVDAVRHVLDTLSERQMLDLLSTHG